MGLLFAAGAAAGYGLHEQGKAGAEHVAHGDIPDCIDPVTGLPIYYPNLPQKQQPAAEQRSSLFGSHGNADLTNGGPDYKIDKTINLSMSVKVDGAITITQMADKIAHEIASKQKNAMASAGAGATGSDTTPFVFGGF